MSHEMSFNFNALSNTEISENLVKMAIGRLFRIMSRPFQEGDHEIYRVCRSIIMQDAENRGRVPADHRPNYARDWNTGAQGDHA